MFSRVTHDIVIVWFCLSRLETRTKESNTCASQWHVNATDVSESKVSCMADDGGSCTVLTVQAHSVGVLTT